jgi:hypothetical protein
MYVRLSGLTCHGQAPMHEIMQPFNIGHRIHPGCDSGLIRDHGNTKARGPQAQDGLRCPVRELPISLSIDIALIDVQRSVAIEKDDFFRYAVHELRMPRVQGVQGRSG